MNAKFLWGDCTGTDPPGEIF